jgi:hypothetical protein
MWSSCCIDYQFIIKSTATVQQHNFEFGYRWYRLFMMKTVTRLQDIHIHAQVHVLHKHIDYSKQCTIAADWSIYIMHTPVNIVYSYLLALAPFNEHEYHNLSEI